MPWGEHASRVRLRRSTTHRIGSPISTLAFTFGGSGAVLASKFVRPQGGYGLRRPPFTFGHAIRAIARRCRRPPAL